ncbi:MAG: cobalamin biosynthesis protein CobD [Deltaproteobacteria bacterium]|nr:cobalamin biosynthesis protein CobD [Deltaproteobacteria bacterium]MBW2121932.1 cobalamin biosynthesis protein CobD [Deltaproteobacteria bacterium]
MTGQIIIAYLADLIFGDPRWLPHPVVMMGKGIALSERLLLRPGLTERGKKWAGCVLVGLVVGGTWVLAEGSLRLARCYDWRLGVAVSIFLAYTTLATRSLGREASSVVERLGAGDTTGARKRLAGLVSRDTRHLDDSEICRAVVETVAENTSDGIVAPLFYLGIGGPALALAYKAVNTLDSMVGYRNSRYLDFGWASARLDDAANFLPSRITALLIVWVSFVLGRDWKKALETAWREGRNHESPNAGFPEAAVAGALGIRLGGPSVYFGEVLQKPYIGKAFEPVSVQRAGESIGIMFGVSLAMVAAVAVTLMLVSALS